MAFVTLLNRDLHSEITPYTIGQTPNVVLLKLECVS